MWVEFPHWYLIPVILFILMIFFVDLCERSHDQHLKVLFCVFFICLLFFLMYLLSLFCYVLVTMFREVLYKALLLSLLLLLLLILSVSFFSCCHAVKYSDCLISKFLLQQYSLRVLQKGLCYNSEPQITQA